MRLQRVILSPYYYKKGRFVRKLKLIFTALFLVGPLPASASNWVEIARSPEGSIWYIDVDSIIVDGNFRDAWIRMDGSKNRTVEYRERTSLYRAYCGRRQMDLRANRDEYANGKTEHNNFENFPLNFQTVRPDSMIESAYEAICAR